MRYKYFTGIGKRESNQDLILVSELSSGRYLFLIADGMGGYEMGDRAATIVAEHIASFLKDQKDLSQKTIQTAVDVASDVLSAFNKENRIKSGATIGGLIAEEQTAYFFWLGDVKTYLFRGGDVVFESLARTLINDLAATENRLNPRSINRFKHIVTRSVSGTPKEIGFEKIQLEEGDKVIICSDGVHDLLSTNQIGNTSFEEIQAFLESEASDNFSLIKVEF